MAAEASREQPSARDKNSTRAKILAAAAAIVAEEGVTGISTRRIGKRAGVNQALIHYHFGSIENLMLELLQGIALQATSRVAQQYGGSEPFVDQWRADIAATLSSDLASGWGRTWIQTMAFMVPDPKLLERYRQLNEVHDDILVAAARRSLEAEGDRDPEDAELLAEFASVVKAGLIVIALTHPSFDSQRVVELADSFLRGWARSAGSAGFEVE